jgi:decaprenylphospho-beta-D-erythro-pentofuranosid-2-ulose 2-reductase
LIYKNKTALIIGGNSDIGKAIALELAKAKCNLILTSRIKNSKNSFCSHLRIKFGITVENLFLDICSHNTFEDFTDSLNSLPDLIFITVGYLDEQKKSFENLDDALLSMNTNYIGPSLILNKLSSKLISNNKSCKIIAISSVAGLRGRSSNFIYGSSKSGFITYLSGLRNYLFNYGINVLTVLPGFVDTKMTSHLNLPRFLTISPELLANKIVKSINSNKNVIYSNLIWFLIMTVIKLIPETIFKRLKL